MMEWLLAFWNKNIGNKLIVGIVALTLGCCGFALVVPSPPEQAPSAAGAGATTVGEPSSSPLVLTALPASQNPTHIPEATATLTVVQEQASVVEVIDGDTIDVNLNGAVVRLRLIGIDTPETVDPRRPVECFGQAASARAKEVLTGHTVMLEADATQDNQDRYGRLLRYVWLDTLLFNRDMITQGYAFEYTYTQPYRYQTDFQQAQADARMQQRGLWSPATCNGERHAAQPTTTPTPLVLLPTGVSKPTVRPAQNCHPAYPDGCIPSPPPDLDCADIPYRRFRVRSPDPHRFDRDNDGIGCES